MVIRHALSGDLPQLLALYPHLNPSDPIPSLEVAHRRLEALQKYPGSAVFIGIVDASTIASCTLVVIPNLTRGGQPCGLIENVVTHAQHRGRGYGKQVLRAAVMAAWDADLLQGHAHDGIKRPRDVGLLRFSWLGAKQDWLPSSAPPLSGPTLTILAALKAKRLMDAQLSGHCEFPCEPTAHHVGASTGGGARN